MPRNIGSAILGYVIMFIAMFLLMTLFWFLLGTDGAFEPDSWNVTGVWIMLLLAAAFLAAMLGGVVTSKFATDHRGIWILAGIVFILGFVFALPLLTGSLDVPTGPRPEDLAMFDAMQQGQQPAWAALLNPIIGTLGVLVGGRMRK